MEVVAHELRTALYLPISACVFALAQSNIVQHGLVADTPSVRRYNIRLRNPKEVAELKRMYIE